VKCVGKLCRPIITRSVVEIYTKIFREEFFYVVRTVQFGMKLYNDQRNAQVFNLSIYFCRTCFGFSFSPSSEVGVQIRQWFKSSGYGVSVPLLWAIYHHAYRSPWMHQVECSRQLHPLILGDRSFLHHSSSNGSSPTVTRQTFLQDPYIHYSRCNYVLHRQHSVVVG
jgi:hypothetical protein